MLGGSHGPPHDGGDDRSAPEDSDDLSLSETKARASDAATALAAALENEGRDPKRIVQAFRSLYTLCCHLDELEESGETDDEPEEEDSKEEDVAKDEE